MAQVLLIWNSNWSDEMDIDGWVTMDSEDWKSYKKLLKNREEGFTFYVGTNEEMEYENGKELLDEITAKKISDEEAKVLNKLFDGAFGFTCFTEVGEDEEEWDDYDEN